MKLLSKDILREYGFSDDVTKSNALVEVMNREGFDVLIQEGGLFFYSNFGIDYPLKDLTALRKVFKEAKSKELTPFL
jgi:hypothetical protein